MNTIKEAFWTLVKYGWHIIFIAQILIIFAMIYTNKPKVDILSEEMFAMLAFVMIKDQKRIKLKNKVKQLKERIVTLEESNKAYEDGEI